MDGEAILVRGGGYGIASRVFAILFEITKFLVPIKIINTQQHVLLGPTRTDCCTRTIELWRTPTVGVRLSGRPSAHTSAFRCNYCIPHQHARTCKGSPSQTHIDFSRLPLNNYCDGRHIFPRAGKKARDHVEVSSQSSRNVARFTISSMLASTSR